MTTYPIDQKLQDRLDNDYGHQTPQGDQGERYQILRDQAKELAVLICNLCPESRERSLALTFLETAVLQANAAIAKEDYVPA